MEVEITFVVKGTPNFADKTNQKNWFFLGFFIWDFGFPIDIIVNGKIETPLKLHCVVKVPVNERLNSFLFQHSVMTNPTIFKTISRSDAYEFVQDFVLFLSGKK